MRYVMNLIEDKISLFDVEVLFFTKYSCIDYIPLYLLLKLNQAIIYIFSAKVTY